jgi:hypothetical protein
MNRRLAVYFDKRARPVRNPVKIINFLCFVRRRAKNEKIALAEKLQRRASGFII